ncbi:helix-turn-helix domain-containing protein [Stutzerimonas nitrititolerans]|uniref:helix-turn-helix domain-containing protein n=1 Tax=Stutzerimonas nitrititolerans TaxID=2482751 RepID=UPI0028965ABD|nr:helix-turn-helix transcriptional regulator [Stutzerimonas nitrititolerans]
MNLATRLKAERERLGFSQTDFAALAGASKHSQINWEKGAAAPNATVLAAWAAHGMDVLYVVTGQRSNRQTSADMTESADSVTAGIAEIDEELMRRIVTMLAKSAKDAGRRWDSERLMLAAVDVYKFLTKEPMVDDDKLERVLKLVINR